MAGAKLRERKRRVVARVMYHCLLVSGTQQKWKE
jgi:hypothetical protein